MTNQKTCQNYLLNQNPKDFQEVKVCTRRATHVVRENGHTFEYVCRQHAEALRRRGLANGVDIVEMQGC